MEVGDIYSTSHGELEVLEFINKTKVLVRFISTGYERFARYEHIISGKVKDRLKPKVFGVGFIGDETTKIDGKKTLHYRYWSGVLQRCYCDKYKILKPTYGNCTSSANFKSFKFFREWCSSQVGFGNEGWSLDKDLLFKGNKLYSESTCVFIPQEVNSLILNKKSIRGVLPIGVSKHKEMNSFSSSLSVNGKMKYLGSFKTPEEAFFAYKIAKEDHIKEVANKWKDKIDPRVYEALMNYQVEITD